MLSSAVLNDLTVANHLCPEVRDPEATPGSRGVGKRLACSQSAAGERRRWAREWFPDDVKSSPARTRSVSALSG